MTRAILFDLDDTLLGNDMDVFMPLYFKLLSDYTAERHASPQLVQHLISAARAMTTNVDPCVSNEQAFWDEFSELTGLDHKESTPFFARFYETKFNDIQGRTERRPEGRQLVEWALGNGYRVAIATNPMFPRIAVERRLAWAGIDVDEFDLDLVTSYENMHFTKPHQAYYREILNMLDVPPGEALMVGDDWERDIVPAGQVGIHTYWITATQQPSLDTPHGTLKDLWELCQNGELERHW